MANELRERSISFYPAIGRKGYSYYISLSEEDRKKKENRPKFRRTSTKSLSLQEVAECISSPLLKELTEEVRSAEDYKLKKTFLLDNVVFGGIPKDSEGKTRRKKDNFSKEREGVVFSGLVVIDLDHLKEQGIGLSELREVVSQDKEIGLRLLFTSPSGDGLKLICKSKNGFDSAESYEREYFALVNYLSTFLRNIFPLFVVDTSGKDISRTCFLCYDPEALLFDNDNEFDSSKYPAPIKERPKRNTYLSRYQAEEDGIEELVQRVEESRIDIAPNYKEYYPLVCSFSALGERGRQYLHRVCSLSPKYSPEDTDFDFDNNVPNTRQYIGYFVNLCKDNGINVSRVRKTYLQEYKQMKTESKKSEETPEKLSEEIKQLYESRLPKKKDLLFDIAEQPGGIETGYYFQDREGRKEALRISLEGITMVAALSNHCKSIFLRNLALELSQQRGKGDILFLTYEESETKSKLRFLNTFVGEGLQTREKNIDLIRRYAKETNENKRDKVLTDNTRDILKDRVKGLEELLNSGKLNILSVYDTSSELVSFLEYYQKIRPIGAVFVDYIQRISSGYYGDRREDLRRVAYDLQEYSKKYKTPIIVAAQLNRQTPSPEGMGANNLAESADLTRYAETIVCLWNSAKIEDLSDDKYPSSPHYMNICSRGFTMGTPGHIYAKITKNKEGEDGIDAVFNFIGNSEKILHNSQGEKNENDLEDKEIDYL